MLGRFKTKEAMDMAISALNQPPAVVPSSKPDYLSEPIRNVVDGWKLRNGSLVLYVKCSDNITREVVVKR